jgi:hypothetical protein
MQLCTAMKNVSERLNRLDLLRVVMLEQLCVDEVHFCISSFASTEFGEPQNMPKFQASRKYFCAHELC